MLKTESRPAPLPPRPEFVQGSRMPVPAGAAKWSRLWLDGTGVAQSSDYDVPVDADNRRTEHVRNTCRGKITIAEVEQPCDEVAWLLPSDRPRYCSGHGVALEPEAKAKAGGVPWGKVWDVADERIRVAAAGVAVGVAGVGLDAAELPWWGDLIEIAALPAVVASSWWLTRWWLTRHAIKHNKIDPDDEIAGKRRRKLIAKRARIGGYAASGAAFWVACADLLGVIPGNGDGKALLVALLGGLAGVTILGGRPYVRYVDASRVLPTEVVTPAEAPDPTTPRLPAGMIAEQKWMEHTPNGAVPNTVLLPNTYRKVIGGWGIMIRATVPGAVDIDMLTDQSAKGRLRVIAGTFGLPKKVFNFVSQDDPNEVLMLVQPNPPLAEGQVWEGPGSIDVDKGLARSGRLIDGSPMFEPYYKYGWGAPSKIVTGTTGSGKSENLRKQIIIERYFAFQDPKTGQKRGMFATFLHDFKQFESYGEFRRALPASGSTVDDAYIMRDALIREMERRYATLSSYQWVDKKNRRREGGIKWDPRIHGPVLSWVIDEFHEIAKDQAFIGPLELLARKMRACGIRITIGTHMGTLGDTGSRGFRDMLAGGYALLGRTTDGLTSVVTGGQLTADPRQLPKLPGMCLVADGETQTMHARQSYIPSDEDEPMNVYDLLFDDKNNPIGYPAVLPPETLEAFGPEWVQWADAGRQPGGRPAGEWSPKPDEAQKSPASDAADAKKAKDAIASILASAPGPLDIDGVDGALQAYRARGVKCGTSMARKVLAELVTKKFAFKPKHGFYQISEHAQEDLLSQLAEEAEVGQ
jgi:hypothetical protein